MPSDMRRKLNARSSADHQPTLPDTDATNDAGDSSPVIRSFNISAACFATLGYQGPGGQLIGSSGRSGTPTAILACVEAGIPFRLEGAMSGQNSRCAYCGEPLVFTALGVKAWRVGNEFVCNEFCADGTA